MMIRDDQHVDDWAETAVDYLDGRLDDQGRAAVEAHLSACSACAARLHTQQYVVTVLQEAVLDDPPEDLEYRSIGEIVFPSPGAEPAFLAPQDKKVYRSPRWFRAVRPWIPAGVAVVALLSAVVGYGIVRSNQPASVASDTAKQVFSATTTAGATATTAAAAIEEARTTAAAGSDMTATTAAAATTTTAVLAGSTATYDQPATFTATKEPKAMVSALQSTQAPAFVTFRVADSAPATDDQTTIAGEAPTTSTAVLNTATTSAGGTRDSSGATVTQTTARASVSTDATASLLEQLKEFTGLEPVDRSLWLGGPTFAVYLPRKDASKLVDLVRSISASVGLQVSVEGQPPAAVRARCDELLANKASFPVLKAHRAGQPATVGYDFTTSTLAPKASGGTTDTSDAMPADTHVIVVIWIAE